MHWHTIACTEYLYTCVVNTSVLASYLLLILHDRCNALQSLDIHEGNIIMLRFTNIEICYNNSRSSTCVLYFFLSTNKIIFLIDNFYFSTFITFYEYMVLYGVRDRHLVIYMYYLFFIFIDYYNYYYYYTILYYTLLLLLLPLLLLLILLILMFLLLPLLIITTIIIIIMTNTNYYIILY